ncbi:T7SS effector LXG polymorphic toxin [Virgibacillus necropolis]|uniref:LXG domain-containing protein n=1 Tax=Virgibacillus necropolis TaxID=163877 RepID=A0A221M9A4_9BACI|nr:T7SS effector LXG polymorphic toxin [Virgibacillus necropolis]ASN04217.1 hypothetical protein CFK40_03940 [Virgibacillus necropolis]
MKVLDAESLHNGIKETLADLESFHEQMKRIQKSLDEFISLEDSFKGKGAQAIRSFYQECHIPLLLFMEGFIADYQETLKQIATSLQMLEPETKGFIDQSFLEHDVKRGLKKAESVTSTLTGEANRAIESVWDIVSLPKLDDAEFLYNVNRSRKHVNETIETLHAFDSESTAKLESVENDVHLMARYIQQLSGMLRNGDLSIANYSVRQLAGNDVYQGVIKGVTEKAVGNGASMKALLGLGAKQFLARFNPLSDILINYIQKRYEFRTMDYSIRAVNVLIDLHSKSISQEEFATLKSNRMSAEEVTDYQGEFGGVYYTLLDGRMIRQFTDKNGKIAYRFVDSIPKDRIEPVEEKNPFVKTIDSFQEIGSDIWGGFEERGDKAFDSWSGFGNYLTMGAFDGVYEGMQQRSESKMNSPTDFANWLSMGSVDLVQGAVNPKEPFSKEHWLSSFGLATVAIGGVKKPIGVNRTSPIKPIVRPPNVSPRQWTWRLKPPVVKSMTNRMEWFRLNFLNFSPGQRWDLAVDMPGENSGYSFIKDFDRERVGSDKETVNGFNTVKEIDFGRHIIKDKNGKKQLLPNTVYITNDNYKYTTDEFGRIVNVETPDLVLKKADRNKYAQANIGGKDRLPDDDGGHLIGAQFNGPPDIDNLVPQNSQINRRGGVWYEMETEWANALKEIPPKKVSVSIEPMYSNSSMRPDSFIVEYEIEGQFPVIREVANKSGG